MIVDHLRCGEGTRPRYRRSSPANHLRRRLRQPKSRQFRIGAVALCGNPRKLLTPIMNLGENRVFSLKRRKSKPPALSICGNTGEPLNGACLTLYYKSNIAAPISLHELLPLSTGG